MAGTGRSHPKASSTARTSRRASASTSRTTTSKTGDPDPFKQECLGLYGYGTGYRLAHDHSREMMVAKMGLSIEIPGLCEVCPKHRECCHIVVNDRLLGGESVRDVWTEYAERGRAAFVRRAQGSDLKAALLLAKRLSP